MDDAWKQCFVDEMVKKMTKILLTRVSVRMNQTYLYSDYYFLRIWPLAHLPTPAAAKATSCVQFLE